MSSEFKSRIGQIQPSVANGSSLL